MLLISSLPMVFGWVGLHACLLKWSCLCPLSSIIISLVKHENDKYIQRMSSRLQNITQLFLISLTIDLHAYLCSITFIQLCIPSPLSPCSSHIRIIRFVYSMILTFRHDPFIGSTYKSIEYYMGHFCSM